MADFYQEMRQMTRDLLAPTSSGGLGQGHIQLQRPDVDSDDPWAPGTPLVETIRAAVRGIDKRMVGVEVGGTVLVASDQVAICEVPDMGYKAGDELVVDGRPVQILAYEPIPAAGITSAVRFIIRR